jgi:hypothetical protein
MGIASDYADGQALNYYVVIPFTDPEPAEETVVELEALGLVADIVVNGHMADHEVWVHCGPREGQN